MKKSFRGILVFLALFLTLAFGVIVANQTLQVALFAERFHPAAGDAVFWALVFTYAALLLVPLYLLLRLPRSLIPPDEDSGPAFEAHLAELRKRLGRNPRTRAMPVPLLAAALAEGHALPLQQRPDDSLRGRRAG